MEFTVFAVLKLNSEESGEAAAVLRLTTTTKPAPHRLLVLRSFFGFRGSMEACFTDSTY